MVNVKYLDYTGLGHLRTKYISKIQNDLVKVSNDLNNTNQNIEELEKKINNDAYKETVSQLTDQLSSVFSDIARLSFQLDLNNVLDSSELKHVIVDEFDTVDSITIKSGIYRPTNKDVYI